MKGASQENFNQRCCSINARQCTASWSSNQTSGTRGWDARVTGCQVFNWHVWAMFWCSGWDAAGTVKIRPNFSQRQLQSSPDSYHHDSHFHTNIIKDQSNHNLSNFMHHSNSITTSNTNHSSLITGKHHSESRNGGVFAWFCGATCS